MSIVAAVQLARDLQGNPALARRLPLSRFDEALAALLPAPAIGDAARVILIARQHRCGVVEPAGVVARSGA